MIWALRTTGVNRVLWTVYGLALFGFIGWYTFQGFLAIEATLGFNFRKGTTLTGWALLLAAIVFSCAIAGFVAQLIFYWTLAFFEFLVSVIYDYRSTLKAQAKEALDEEADASDVERGGKFLTQAQATERAKKLTAHKLARKYRPSLWRRIINRVLYAFRPKKRFKKYTDAELLELHALHKSSPKGSSANWASAPTTDEAAPPIIEPDCPKQQAPQQAGTGPSPAGPSAPPPAPAQSAPMSEYDRAKKKAAEWASQDEPTIFWGMFNFPATIAETHLLVVGASGSGKTTILRFLMQSVLPRIRPGSRQRAFIYDAKRDMLPILKGMNLKCPIHILNPFDKNSSAWDLAADITTPADAQQLAATLIPAEEQATQRYFTDAARHLLCGVLLSFIAKVPGRWTLRDVVLAMRSPDQLMAVLRQTDRSREIGEMHTKNEQTFHNVFSTIATKMQPFEIVAALWSKAKTRVSLSRWLKQENEESILMFAHHPKHSEAVLPINQAIFKYISGLLLSGSGPDAENQEVWFFLDEVREAGRLEGLRSLLNQGRSKGARVVLGFQDIEGMRKQYGREEAHEIVGLCSSKTFLRTSSSATALWAQEHFGEAQVREEKVSVSTSEQSGHGGGGSSNSTTTAKSFSSESPIRHVLMSSQLTSIPQTGPTHGLRAFHHVPLFGSYPTKTTWDEVMRLLVREDKTVQGEETRPDNEQFLDPWSPAETEEKCPSKATTAAPSPASPENPPKNPEPPRAIDALRKYTNRQP